MYRNHYDQDCITWSPQGRIFQIDYAMEAVRQGSISIGLKSNNYGVLVALKRTPHEKMAGYQEKVFEIDTHMGMSMSGITADGKSQFKTIISGKRPYGVGLLVLGKDLDGIHLYTTLPNAEYFEYLAFAIGAKSQSAKTYLEKHFEGFEECSMKELITHGLKALKASERELELTKENVSIGTLGKDSDFTILGGDEVTDLIQSSIPATEPDLPDVGEAPMES